MSPNQSLNTNQVGYAQKNLQEGVTIVTPQFLGVATENGKIALQSITCRDEDSDQVALCTLDSVGATVKLYLWITWGGENGNEKYWIDSDTMEKPTEEVYFDVGQAFWVQGENTDNAFTSAGQVGTKDVAVQLQEGATLTGNFTPVSINLQDILCRDEDSDQVALCTLDSVGATKKMYLWITWGGENGNEKYWIDSDTMEKPTEDVVFSSGEGLWVQGESTSNVVTLPGVEL